MVAALAYTVLLVTGILFMAAYSYGCTRLVAHNPALEGVVARFTIVLFWTVLIGGLVVSGALAIHSWSQPGSPNAPWLRG